MCSYFGNCPPGSTSLLAYSYIPTWAAFLDPSSLQLLPQFTAYYSSPGTLRKCLHSLFRAK